MLTSKAIRFFLLLTLLAPTLVDQEFRAMISGTVTDPSGAAIPGATVTATNLNTNTHTVTKSASDGNMPWLSCLQGLTNWPWKPRDLSATRARPLRSAWETE